MTPIRAIALLLLAFVVVACGLSTAQARGDVWTLPGSDGIETIVADYRPGVEPSLVGFRNWRELVRISLLTGEIATLAGDPNQEGFVDGDASQARFNIPHGLVVDGDGRVIISDTWNHRIREFDPNSKQVTTIAGGNGEGITGITGYGCQSGHAITEAAFDSPSGIALGDDGRKVIIVDRGNNRICELDRQTQVVSDIIDPNADDGLVDGPLVDARFSEPHSVVSYGQSKLLVSEIGNERVRLIDRVRGTVATVAGTGSYDSMGAFADGDATTIAKFDSPQGLVLDRNGDLLIVDSGNGKIRRLDLATYQVTTYAGKAAHSNAPIDGPNHEAIFTVPRRVVLGPDGTYVVDDGTRRGKKRKVFGNVGVFVSDSRVRYIGPNDELEAKLAMVVKVGLAAAVKRDQPQLDAQRKVLSEMIVESTELFTLARDVTSNWQPTAKNYLALLPRELQQELSCYRPDFNSLRVKMALARLPERVPSRE